VVVLAILQANNFQHLAAVTAGLGQWSDVNPPPSGLLVARSFAATLDLTASEATLLLTRSAALSIDAGPWLVLSPCPPCARLTSTPTTLAAGLMLVTTSGCIGTLGHRRLLF